jgi:NTP pyrophosphatase (non-canonical NTP hydrolase)
MDLNEYQEYAKETDLNNPLNYYYLGLAEEAGEVAGLRKRFLRDEGNIEYDIITKELGDVLWYLAMIADKYNLSLNDIAYANILKLRDRKERGVIKGKGDNR